MLQAVIPGSLQPRWYFDHCSHKDSLLVVVINPDNYFISNLYVFSLKTLDLGDNLILEVNSTNFSTLTKLYGLR